MKLKIFLIISIIVLILLPVTHGAVSIYRDLKTEEPETIEATLEEPNVEETEKETEE